MTRHAELCHASLPARPLADRACAWVMWADLRSRLLVGGAALAELDELIGAPWRRYHGAGHLGVLWYRHLTHGGDPDDMVIAHAIAYHDAVYAVGASDNEARSAALWRAHAAGVSLALRDAVARAVMATEDHTALAETAAGRRLVDLDLTPLGEPWVMFEASSRALREEARAPSIVMPDGRVRFFRRLLALPRIFRAADGMIARSYETTTRDNLCRVLG